MAGWLLVLLLSLLFPLRSLPFSTIHIKAQNSWTPDGGEPNEQRTSECWCICCFYHVLPNCLHSRIIKIYIYIYILNRHIL